MPSQRATIPMGTSGVGMLRDARNASINQICDGKAMKIGVAGNFLPN